MNKPVDSEIKNLASQLREICDQNGKEIDCAASAEIIYQIGLVHKKESSDKISLIKSVGLLNAAVARNPDNVSQIQSDLSSLCRQILQQSQAQKQNVDLIGYASYVKTLTENMRDSTNQALEEEIEVQTQKETSVFSYLHVQQHKISLVQKLQMQITEQYTDIMQQLSHFCIETMGPPPCKYAVVGMGSLARKEVTPYSDFEHIILVENHENCEEHYEYFRWFSVIFHTIILCLQETIIPSLNIEYLNDKSTEFGDWFFDTYTSGVSFDGMMPHACKFPLGRQKHTEKKPWSTELIKQVDDMLKYLCSEEILKNGYHLSDILMDTCFVYGNEEVYDVFSSGVLRHKNSKTEDERLLETKEQVLEDLEKFSARFTLSDVRSRNQLNIKQLFYRSSTLFIAALGKAYNVKSSSSFEIIDELNKLNQISDFGKQKLLVAAAMACDIRLRIYMKMKSQHDYIQSEKAFDEFLLMFDLKNLINYLQITYCLQCEIIKVLNIKTVHIYSNPKFLNLAICHSLKLNELLHALLTNHIYYPHSDTSDEEEDLSFERRTYNFDKCVSFLEGQIDRHYDDVNTIPATIVSAFSEEFFAIALFLFEKQQYNEAFEFSQFMNHCRSFQHKIHELDCKEIELVDPQQLYELIGIYFAKSRCLIELKRNEEAVVAIDKLIKVYQILSGHKTHQKFSLVYGHYVIGESFYRLNYYHNALEHFLLSLSFQISLNYIENEYDLTFIYSGIGACLMYCGQYKESLVYMSFAVKTLESYYSHDTVEIYFLYSFSKITVYLNQGKCLMKVQRFEDALVSLQKALIATEEIDLAEINNRKQAEITNILYEIGVCHMKLNRFENSLHYFEQCLVTPENLFLDRNIGKVHRKMLTCYLEIYQHNSAKELLKKLHSLNKTVLVIKQNSLFLTFSIKL